jgi:hypothetical protein
MTQAQFVESTGLRTLSEADKVCYLAFFYLKTNNTVEFTALEAARWLHGMGFRPNVSRLRRNMSSNRATVRGSRVGTYRLHPNFVAELTAKFPSLSEPTDDVMDDPGTVVPKAIYQHTRGYIEKLAAQINVCYEHSAFDGCAVLMRRVIEILLILTFEHKGLGSDIRDVRGNYAPFEEIVDKAKSSTVIGLSRDSKNWVDEYRALGNFSAHKIEYNCRRDDLKSVLRPFRTLFEELLYKSGLRT